MNTALLLSIISIVLVIILIIILIIVFIRNRNDDDIICDNGIYNIVNGSSINDSLVGTNMLFFVPINGTRSINIKAPENPIGQSFIINNRTNSSNVTLTSNTTIKGTGILPRFLTGFYIWTDNNTLENFMLG